VFYFHQALDGIVDTVFASADVNADGRVSFDEFIHVFGTA